jgi:hypothetical protein
MIFATRPSRGSFGFGVSLSGRANPHVDRGRLIDAVFVEAGANQHGVRSNLIPGTAMSAEGPQFLQVRSARHSSYPERSRA